MSRRTCSSYYAHLRSDSSYLSSLGKLTRNVLLSQRVLLTLIPIAYEVLRRLTSTPINKHQTYREQQGPRLGRLQCRMPDASSTLRLQAPRVRGAAHRRQSGMRANPIMAWGSLPRRAAADIAPTPPRKRTNGRGDFSPPGRGSPSSWLSNRSEPHGDVRLVPHCSRTPGTLSLALPEHGVLRRHACVHAAGWATCFVDTLAAPHVHQLEALARPFCPAFFPQMHPHALQLGPDCRVWWRTGTLDSSTR
jgi:hypothetical protein